GIVAYEAGDFETAAAQVEQALAAGMTDYSLDQAHTVLGNIYTDLDRLEAAIEQHQQALQINPDNHEVWVNLGVTYRLMGNYSEAEKAYRKALALAPDYPELHASLGALFVVKGEAQPAIEHLEQAAELDGNLAITFANLSLAYALAERFDEAETTLKRALALGYQNGSAVKDRIDALERSAE
ncbi:MAG: tetratricopeptide repeat protein, partial [Leptolyngbya sp. SIO4C1]|nr:tetratricopeptide repeat protein [Leptolyngbya sp. SIO4C1]